MRTSGPGYLPQVPCLGFGTEGAGGRSLGGYSHGSDHCLLRMWHQCCISSYPQRSRRPSAPAYCQTHAQGGSHTHTHSQIHPHLLSPTPTLDCRGSSNPYPCLPRLRPTCTTAWAGSLHNGMGGMGSSSGSSHHWLAESVSGHPDPSHRTLTHTPHRHAPAHADTVKLTLTFSLPHLV